MAVAKEKRLFLRLDKMGCSLGAVTVLPSKLAQRSPVSTLPCTHGQRETALFYSSKLDEMVEMKLFFFCKTYTNAQVAA